LQVGKNRVELCGGHSAKIWTFHRSTIERESDGEGLKRDSAKMHEEGSKRIERVSDKYVEERKLPAALG
jgi:hypothetical protein